MNPFLFCSVELPLRSKKMWGSGLNFSIPFAENRWSSRLSLYPTFKIHNQYSQLVSTWDFWITLCLLKVECWVYFLWLFWLFIIFWRLFSTSHFCPFARKTLMNWGNCKKQKKGMQWHCHISKQHGFQQALREGAFANVRIIFKTACNFTIDNSRWNSEHK